MNTKRQESLKRFISNLHDSERLYIIKQCALAMKDAEVKYSVKPIVKRSSHDEPEKSPNS